MSRSQKKLTRVGVFYDGNYFLHVSNFYNYNHDRKRRISIAGLHDFIKAKVAEEENTEAHLCSIVEAKYFRGRLSAKSAKEKDNRLYYDRVFSDILMSEYVQSQHLPLRSNHGRLEEKGIDVLLAVEAMALAGLDQIDVLVLIASDGDYVPLVRKLPALGVRTMILSWNFEFEEDGGRMSVTRVSQDLLNWATYPVDMTSIIDDPLEDEESLVDELFVSHDSRHEEYREDYETSRVAEEVLYEDDEEAQTSEVMSLKNGFGFINWPDNNLFFYHGDVEGVDFKALRIGDMVTFTITENERGENIAKRVSLTNPEAPEEGAFEEE
ncbi:MAG: NYN domain-containing protein [Saprospiraceae bacterium]